MDFPTALKHCLDGKRITNLNWNGKGMFVFRMNGYKSVPANGALATAAGFIEGTAVSISPYLMMKNANGEYVSWLISNMDVFSDAWEIKEDY